MVDFQLNTRTLYSQPTPAVAALADGGFVAVWQAAYQDGMDYGVFGQRYDANGNPVGEEFQINESFRDDQDTPSVTALANGGFVVTWQSRDFGGTEYDIFIQQYDATGEEIGGETVVNANLENWQTDPTITALTDGGFVVAWQSRQQDQAEEEGRGYGIFAQRFNASGGRVSGEFQVNTAIDRNQSQPALADLDDGFVAVWQSLNQDGDEYGIFGQRFAADGTLLGSEFQVNTTTIGSQNNPAIATLTDNSIVVVWNSYGQDGSAYGIVAQRLATDGTPIGGEWVVNSATVANQQRPDITALTDGGFVITWRSQATFGGDYQVLGQRYDAAGNPVGTDFQINGVTPTQDQGKPAIAGLANGGFVTLWHSLAPGGDALEDYRDDYRTYGRQYDASGAALGDQFQVNTFVHEVPVITPVAPVADVTIVIAASNTPAAQAAQADYVASGTGDQDLINQAILEVLGAGGGTVKLLPGIFHVSDNIVLRSNVNLEGSGWRTKIRLQDDSSLSLSGMIRTQADSPKSSDVEIYNARLADFQIDGNRANQSFINKKYGVYGTYTDSIIENIYTRNTPSYGFDPHENSKNGSPTVNLTIRNNIVENSGLDGITLDKVLNATISNNLSINNDRHGFNLVTEAENLILLNNKSVGNGGNGITLQTGSRKIDILGNEIVSNEGNGIYIPEEGDNVLDNNIVLSSGKYGLGIRRSSGNTITNNLVMDSSQLEHDKYSEIELYDDERVYSTFNVVQNNVTRSSLPNQSRYGIREKSFGNDYNTITGNITIGSLRDNYFISGLNTTFVPGNGPVTGTLAADSTMGSDLRDVIAAGLGDDILMGLAGDDVLWGEEGLDTLDGGLGNDYLNGDADADLLYGNLGDDLLDGSFGDDQLFGDAGQDSLYGRSGIDTLDGGEGDDFLWGGSEDDSLTGGDGKDYLNGETGLDSLSGGLGDDFLDGGDGDDVVDGGDGDDLLKGGSGNDQMVGGAGNEYMDGEAGDDVLAGGNGDDLLEGGGGNDRLFGGAGDDILEGGSGQDELMGGLGNDVLHLGQDGATDTVLYNLGDGSDVVQAFDERSDRLAIMGIDQVEVTVLNGSTNLRTASTAGGIGNLLMTLEEVVLTAQNLGSVLDSRNTADFFFGDV
ncbi:MAG: right-handed parallel beta-helix repeat-containing protein [Synechococcales bacterium]|nr:right-handed parallel beta-helix repeat-containing protein [Synechococcales bacterium]